MQPFRKAGCDYFTVDKLNLDGNVMKNPLEESVRGSGPWLYNHSSNAELLFRARECAGYVGSYSGKILMQYDINYEQFRPWEGRKGENFVES